TASPAVGAMHWGNHHGIQYSHQTPNHDTRAYTIVAMRRPLPRATRSQRGAPTRGNGTHPDAPPRTGRRIPATARHTDHPSHSQADGTTMIQRGMHRPYGTVRPRDAQTASPAVGAMHWGNHHGIQYSYQTPNHDTRAYTIVAMRRPLPRDTRSQRGAATRGNGAHPHAPPRTGRRIPATARHTNHPSHSQGDGTTMIQRGMHRPYGTVRARDNDR
ncbi:MAG: hypothetical protein J7M39_09550, partial [Anaerolineae bacterium]|nr:hypothetical protein [Anaerolineae bacterium]